MKVKVLGHLFRLVNLLLLEGKPMSVMELSRRSGVEKSAVWRIVGDLCELGYLRRSGYRAVEPGPGLLFLGQAAYSDAFFPHLVYDELEKTEKELGIRCSLAGFFNHHLVYYYRSEQMFDSWRWPLYGSNIALCILTRRDGPEEALRILSENVAVSDLTDAEKVHEIEQIRTNIEHVVKRGYCIQNTHLGNNISFPLVRGGEVYGLAFYLLPFDKEELGNYITRCSQLRTKLATEE